MVGTFLPWKAKTLVACSGRLPDPSVEGMFLCRFSWFRSFVVVILVSRAATSSMMSATGIMLTSNRVSSNLACLLENDLEEPSLLLLALASSFKWSRFFSCTTGGCAIDAVFCKEADRRCRIGDDVAVPGALDETLDDECRTCAVGVDGSCET